VSKSTIFFIFTVVALLLTTVHGSLPITDYEYPLMHYTKLISEKHFTPGRPLVIVLPQAEEDSTNNEVGYLIEELHTSGRWHVLVFNFRNKRNEDTYT
jgi:predicted alpha/beta-fold hydrolase